MFELEESYKEILNSFKNAKNHDKLAHAYLFSSNNDRNVKNIAKYVMMLYYCENLKDKQDEPCLMCSSCQKVINDIHINFYEVDSTGSSIKKEQIEKLQAEFSKTSLEEGIRIYLIDNCEKMTTSSANSLLKFLEEPLSKNTYAFLITDNLSECLPTIISRCQTVKLKNKSRAEIKKLLVDKIDEKNSILLSNYCSNVTEVLDYLENDTFFEMIEFIKKIMRMVLTNDKGLLSYYKDNIGMVFIDKSNINKFFQLFLYYFLDLYKINSGFNDIIFIEEKEIMIELANLYKKDKINKFINYLQEVIKRLYFNINESVVLDELIIKLRM